MADATARLGLPYAVLNDAADISNVAQPLAEALDPATGPNVAFFNMGTSLPEPDSCRFFLNTSTGSFYVSDGTSWYEMATNGGASPVGAIHQYAGATDPVDQSGAARWMICDGRAISRTTYATLFAQLGTTYGAGDGSTTFNIPDGMGRVMVGAGQGSGLTNRLRGFKAGEESHALSVAEMPAHNHGGATGAMSANAAHNHGGATANSGSLAHAHSGTTGTENQSLSHYHGPGAYSDFVMCQNVPTGRVASIAGSGNYYVPTSAIGDFTGWGGTGAASPQAHNHSFTTAASASLIHAHGITSQNIDHTHAVASQGSNTVHNNMQPSLGVNHIIRVL